MTLKEINESTPIKVTKDELIPVKLVVTHKDKQIAKTRHKNYYNKHIFILLLLLLLLLLILIININKLVNIGTDFKFLKNFIIFFFILNN